MIFKNSLFIIFVFLAFSVQAQDRFIRKGNKAFEKGNYPEAISYFRNVKEKNTKINRKIAESYFFLNNYEQAEKYFKKIYDSEKTDKDLLTLSQIYLDAGNYEAAILFSEQAALAGANREDVDRRILAIQELTKISHRDKWRVRELSIQPQSKSLGLAFYSDQLIYSKLHSKKAGLDKTYQLFATGFSEKEKTNLKEFAPKIGEGVDVGASVFSADGKTMYFTQWYTRKGKQIMEIVEAVKEDTWKAANVLPFNSKKYSCAYPALSEDGKIMYFASDMPGGFGGMDLYISHKRGNSWGKPVNLGAEINTTQNEIYPRVLSDGKLWFASNGHVGYGKLDLYFATKTTSGTWGNLKNAGMAFNSQYNEYSIAITREGDQLCFVSDRMNNGAREGFFSIEKLQVKSVELFLRDAKSNAMIDSAQVSVNRIVDNSKIQVDKAEDGSYVLSVLSKDMDKGVLYSIEIESIGFESQQFNFYPESTKEELEIFLKKKEDKIGFSDELEPIPNLQKIKFFRNVYFEPNAGELSAENRKVLDKYAGFWKMFPDLRLVINSHSDSKGSASGNKKMTLKRANLAKNYLTSLGIDEAKIELNAYGEDFIVNGCIDGVECTEDQHRKNRRLELLFMF